MGPLSPAGLVSTVLEGEEAFANVGSRPPNSVEAVLLPWGVVCDGFLELVRGADAEDLAANVACRDWGESSVGQLVKGMIMHQWLYLRLAGEALDAAAAEA